MCKKLLLVRYLGYTTAGELGNVGDLYAYNVETRKSIKKDDFVVLADIGGNVDRKNISVVRVMKVFDGNSSEEEKEKAILECAHSMARDKVFVGKAELGEFFAELDKKRKREELQKKIEKRFKEAEKEALYRKLAETDPEMKALLSELDSLK